MPTAKWLPGGVVTFVITDIEGSTRLLRTWGPATYGQVLERHHALLRAVWDEHEGVEVNTEGDSFIVAFVDSESAVRACAAALRGIDREPWPLEPVRIRIGAHRGPAQPRDGDYVALALHQATRVAGAANGGQAVATDEVLEGFEPEPLIGLSPLGRYRLRDFDGPVNLRQIEPAGLESVSAPLRALPAERHNLPLPPTPLVDRIHEMQRLNELVAPGTVTTVCGPGGVGKTRLATDFGRQRAEHWEGGVWMCELGAVRTRGELPGAVARALGIPLTGVDDPTRQLLGALADRECVLVLDNCEHLAAEAAVFVDDIRTASPSVGVLVTSREPLGLIGERRLRLDPFAVAPAAVDGPGPAVELFALRAAEAGGDTDDVEAMRRVCARLDGLPLAIELAAARSDVLQPREMLASLDRRQGAFQTRDSIAPARHRSIDATIDWSYDLLDDAEKVALRRLTVLRSSFDLDTAVAVCADEALDAELVPELVWSLVSKSVVDRHSFEGETRYRLYSTVRARVRERALRADLVAAAQRLAVHLDSIVGPQCVTDQRWASSADVELDNLRAVIDPEVGVEGHLRLRLLWTVGMLHDVMDQFALGIDELERHVVDAPEVSELVGVLTLLSDLRLRVGDLRGAAHTLSQAEDLAQRIGPAAWDLGGVARTRGELALRSNELDLADRIAREALSTGAAGQPAARLWNLVGLVQANRGDFGAAVTAFEHELAIWNELGNDTAAAVVHGNLAEALLRMGDTSSAAGHQLECLRSATDLGRPLLVAFSLTVAAHLAADASDWALSLALQGASDVLLERADYALYDADDQSRNELLERAHEVLGANDVSVALARGRSMETVETADLAAEVLEVAATG